MGESLRVWRAADVGYADGLRWQQRAHALAVAAREDGRRSESLALIEHRAVVTLGRRAESAHLLATERELAQRGVDLVRADRGGDVTFHGPGQLVAYPILDLRTRGLRAGDYVRGLEAAIIETVASYGVDARRVEGRPGVWIDERTKLGSIGVRISGGVSRHGLALNVSTDLDQFDTIVPCGLAGTAMTSLARELGEGAPSIEAVADRLAVALAGRLDLVLPESQAEVAA